MSRSLTSYDRLLKRFMDRTIPEPNSGCWLWIGCYGSSGYGSTTDGIKTISSHRLAYELFKGNIPAGMSVLHKCDNQVCVNPEHLFIGTQKDNMQDCLKKGRLRPGRQLGESNSQSLLTDDKVRQIKYGIYSTLSGRETAKILGLSPSTVSHVRTGRRWGHVLP